MSALPCCQELETSALHLHIPGQPYELALLSTVTTCKRCHWKEVLCPCAKVTQQKVNTPQPKDHISCQKGLINDTINFRAKAPHVINVT